MDAYLTFAISLLLSLTLWWGSMRATLNGDLDLPASGLRFILALILARTAVGLVSFLINSYQQLSMQTALRNHQDMQALQAAAAPQPQEVKPKRRGSDIKSDPTPEGETSRNEFKQGEEFELFQTSNNDTFPEP